MERKGSAVWQMFHCIALKHFGKDSLGTKLANLTGQWVQLPIIRQHSQSHVATLSPNTGVILSELDSN